MQKKWRSKRKIKSALLVALFIPIMLSTVFSYQKDSGFAQLQNVNNLVKWNIYSKELIITMIDVGQGDGIFIRDPYGKTYLIDGGSSNVSSVGRFRMEPFLLSQGVREIDYVFVSHGDSDHYSGIIEMLENQRLGVRINYLVVPKSEFHNLELENVIEIAMKNSIPVVTFMEGQKLENYEFTILCLGPLDGFIGKGVNDYSMVLSISFRKFSMLLTGDIEEVGERALINSGKLGKHTVLKVAHHGSKTSSIQPFLEMVKPEIALISAGQNNRFNHPNSDVVERIESLGTTIYTTKETGAVILRTDGDRVAVSRHILK